MIRALPRLTAVLVLAASAAVVTGCASAAPTAAPTATHKASTPASSTPAPQSTAGVSAAPAATDPTCETIISPKTVSDFTSLGWTSLSDPLQVGTVELDKGVHCVWGDFTTASDHVQIFGWGAITADQAATAQSDLIAQGWHKVDAKDGLYLTEDASTALAVDDEGYGQTYQFGDGWVKFADTKQGLLLVQWPPS